MWKWEQGRMQYFQYDVLCAVARFAVNHDLKNSDPLLIREATGLNFSAPETHSPWRNYSRVFKLCLIVSDIGKRAVATDVAKILSTPGAITCDEYLHFLIEATTDPSPALSGWSELQEKEIRNPLCFSLKYILAKGIVLDEWNTPINEIISAYQYSNFTGIEDDTSFIDLINKRSNYSILANSHEIRQARESIKFISQISYLHCLNNNIVASLNPEDAKEIFESINPILGERESNGEAEIIRLARFFRDGSEHDFYGYKGTVLSDVMESGFNEGSKVKKTHIVVERNSKLRTLFFNHQPITVCNSCGLDTSKKYPWVKRVLDLHHILPLSSGTRVDFKKGTMLNDLVPVCPTCHRAIHRYYDDYLKINDKKDFTDKDEAKLVYEEAKQKIVKDNFYA